MKPLLRLSGALAVLIMLLGANAASPAPTRAGSDGMKISLDAHAIADARKLTVRWRDLWHGDSPQGWSIDAQLKPGLINQTGPGLLRCQGHIADFSSLTFSGGWQTRFDRITQQTASRLTSATIVLATTAQSRRYYDLVTTWQALYCLRRGTTTGTERYTSVQRIQPPGIADQQAEFRFRFALTNQPSKIYGGSVLYLRRGTVNITLAFIWDHTPVPMSLANALAKKLVARAG